MRDYRNPLYDDDEGGYRIEDEYSPALSAPDSGNELVVIDYIPAYSNYMATKDAQLAYVLLSIRTGSLPQLTNQNPLNVCLVLDQSSSMRGEKLFSVKTAAKQVVDQLSPNDYFSLISFNDRATVVVNCQKVVSRETIKSQIDSIETKGGTELAQGLFSGINEMKHASARTNLNFLLLLTDGQTYGDADRCVNLGSEASRHNIVIHPMGIGNEWNEDLLETIAARSNGSSEFIQAPDQIVKVFLSKIGLMRTTFCPASQLIFRPVPGVNLNCIHKITPVIAELTLENDQAGITSTIALGPLAMSTEYKLLLETVIPPTRPGITRVADLVLNYTEEGTKSWKNIPLSIGLNFTDSTRPSSVNSEVKAVIEKITAFKLQARAWQDIANGDVAGGTRRLSAAGSRLLSMGEVDLAETIEHEISNLKLRGASTEEGKKRIKYGTRGLMGQL